MAAALLWGALSAAHAAPALSLRGPIDGKPILGHLGTFDVGVSGYVTNEFFVSGTAQSYSRVGQAGEDGRWQVQPAITAPYTTRLVVVRPADMQKFNGTVVVEWLNVSGGTDSAADWAYAHREILRGGYAYVGVSAQKVGLEGGPSIALGRLPLKQADPVRYAAITHPGDAFAFDIYSQAAMAVRGAGSAKILGPLEPKRVLAIGESQSAAFLTTYVNAIDPVAKIYDGYLIHSRSAGAAAIEGASMIGGAQTNRINLARMRPDLRVPVISIITETDLMGQRTYPGFIVARQDDTNRLRTWEVPGTAHADTYNFFVSDLDSGSASAAVLAAAYAPRNTVSGQKVDKPVNAAPQHHYVLETALRSLDRWVKTGVAPPTGARMETQAGGEAGAPATLVYDSQGNAKGGIRTPWVDVPTARLSGVGNSGGPLAFLVGVTEPYDQARLSNLYPGGRVDYLKKFERSLAAAIKAGFILPEDEAEIKAVAAAGYPGRK